MLQQGFHFSHAAILEPEAFPDGDLNLTELQNGQVKVLGHDAFHCLGHFKALGPAAFDQSVNGFGGAFLHVFHWNVTIQVRRLPANETRPDWVEGQSNAQILPLHRLPTMNTFHAWKKFRVFLVIQGVPLVFSNESHANNLLLGL